MKYLLSIIILSLILLSTGADRLSEINNSIENQKLLIENLNAKINEFNSSKSSLERQIQDINVLLDNITKDLLNLEIEIEKINQEIKLLEDEIELLKIQIEEKTLELEDLKTQVASLIELIYVKNQNYNLFEVDTQTIMKFVFSDKTSSEIINEIMNISEIEKIIHFKTNEVSNVLLELENMVFDLERLQNSKLELLIELQISKDNLEIQKATQEKLISEKSSGVLNYKSLIQQSKAEQLKAQQELSDLQIDYAKISRQISEKNQSVDDFNSGDSLFSWPIFPKRGISAGFLDPSYKSFIGIDHLAIDIPASQQTKILAPANGQVVKVKDSDNNSYNYIIIAHNQGFTTLYGHVYKSYVNVGQDVKRGEVIGLSGGAPGTRGAGYLTTGAHLHFEVHKNGSHVNPLKYLDKSVLN